MFNQDLFSPSTPSNTPFKIATPVEDMSSLFGEVSSKSKQLPTFQTSDTRAPVPAFGASQLFEDKEEGGDEDIAKLLNLFTSDCSIASNFDIRQLINEVDSIKAQNAKE